MTFPTETMGGPAPICSAGAEVDRAHRAGRDVRAHGAGGDDNGLGGVDLSEEGDLALGDAEQIGLPAGRHHRHLHALAQALAAHDGDALGPGAVTEGATALAPDEARGHLDEER